MLYQLKTVFRALFFFFFLHFTVDLRTENHTVSAVSPAGFDRLSKGLSNVGSHESSQLIAVGCVFVVREQGCVKVSTNLAGPSAHTATVEAKYGTCF